MLFKLPIQLLVFTRSWILIFVFFSFLILSCTLSITGVPDDATDGFLLSSTTSSSIADIIRIPDKPSYNQNDLVTMIASAKTGYTFTGWSGDINSNDDTITVIMNYSKTIYANFRKSSGTSLFSLVTSATEGSITLSPEGGLYDSGTTVHAYPRPGYGFVFEKWSGAVNSKEELVSLVITKNVQLKASFTVDPNADFTTLKIDPSPINGKLFLDPPGAVSGNLHKYKPGTPVTVSSLPDSGYELYSWGKDFSDTSISKKSITITMDKDYTVSATFAKQPDGVHWTVLHSGNQNGLVSIINADKTLVITGNSGTILTSADGTNWTLRSSGVKTCLNCVIWTGKLFVCVGDSSTILTSTDAITWQKQFSTTRDHLQSVVWTGTQFIAVGGYMENSASTYSCILTSPDGSTWTKHSSAYGIWYSIAWNGKILAGSNYDFNFSTIADYSVSYLMRSIDGVNWNSVDTYIPLEASFTSIIWTGSKFVAVGGSRSSDAFSSAYVSSDGDTWEANRIPTRNFINAVTWTGTNLVAAGKKGDIYYSTNGKTWTKSISGTTNDIYDVTWTGSRLYAVGYGGLLLTSP